MADDGPDIEGSDLQALVASEIRQAQTYYKTELADRGSRAIEYLRGEMTDVPARPNGSVQTSRDFADTVAWILPSVVRVFTASDQMVQYDKVREENDDWSRDASEYTNYTFFRENDGYRILYNATYDGLTLGNGVVCSYWEPPRTETKTFRNKTDMELAALMEEEGWQSIGAQPKAGTPKTETLDDPLTGESLEIEVPTITVKLGRLDRPGKICDVTCKPENLLLDSMATTIETARFVAYLHDDKTRSDLVEMAEDYGWDRSVIEDLGADTRRSSSEISDARNSDRYINGSSPFRSGDPVDLYECYIRADIDGDGIAELVQAWFAGNQGQGALLGHEEWDGDVPFTDIPCYPVPHRWDAQSVFDRTADIQRVKTVLLRQALDNTYAVNMPMKEAEAGSVLNPDILVSPKFGGTIWKKPGTNPIQPHVVPYTADKSFVAMQYLDEVTAKRTGVSRSTMALDPEALQNQTATANQNQRDAGYSQVELIARNMAELGWAKWAKKRLKLAIKHEQVRRIPSKRKQEQQGPGAESGFREINPSQWDPNMAVAINVGLGTGSRDRDMAMLQGIMQSQTILAEKLAGSGLKTKAIELIPMIFKTAVKMAESSGLKNPDEYFPEFTDEDLQQAMMAASQPQPDPAVELEKLKQQGAVQLKQADAKTTIEVEQGKNQLAAQQAAIESEAQVRREQAQLEADMQTKALDRENALMLERERQAGAQRLKAMDIAWQREKAMNDAAIAAANAAARAKPNGAQAQ